MPEKKGEKAGNTLREGFSQVTARYAGKKFAIVMTGLGLLSLFLGVYLTLAGDQYDLEQVVKLLMVAMISVAVMVLGHNIGQGLSERRPAGVPIPIETKPPPPTPPT